MSTLHLTHDYHDALEVRRGDTTLFRYVYQPDMAQNESPKPYFHPVHDLAGNLVTIFRPYDHVWHKGIAMTIAHLEDQNFWGGSSYRHGQGYIPLPNNGSQRHDAWDAIDYDLTQFGSTGPDDPNFLPVKITPTRVELSEMFGSMNKRVWRA